MIEAEKAQVHELFAKQANEFANVVINMVESADKQIPDSLPQEQRSKILGNIVQGTTELINHGMNTFAETMAKKTAELKPEDFNV